MRLLSRTLLTLFVLLVSTASAWASHHTHNPFIDLQLTPVYAQSAQHHFAAETHASTQSALSSQTLHLNAKSDHCGGSCSTNLCDHCIGAAMPMDLKPVTTLQAPQPSSTPLAPIESDPAPLFEPPKLSF